MEAMHGLLSSFSAEVHGMGLLCAQETQTKPEGQIHFFPIIFNGKQLYDVMLERCGSTQTSGPK